MVSSALRVCVWCLPHVSINCEDGHACRLTRPNTTTIRENVIRFQYFKPNYDFRTVFEYNNWMVATAGLGTCGRWG